MSLFEPFARSARTLAPLLVERRLCRRAEAAWERLRGEAAAPAVEAAAALLDGPQVAAGLLFVLPLDGRLPQLAFAGSAYVGLPGFTLGLVRPDDGAGAGLAARLASAARLAQRRVLPVRIEGGFVEGAARFVGRAIALPLLGGRGAVEAVVAVAGWRELLDAEETAALHAELLAARSG